MDNDEAWDFNPRAEVVADVVARALAEDLGLPGDLTSIAVIPEDAHGSARIVAREPGVLAGTAAAIEAFRQVDKTVEIKAHMRDGNNLREGDTILTVAGPFRSLLGGERTALNLLQHCSGVATLTRSFVEAVRGRSEIRDTRKTLPGLRALEKAAVRAGGGTNHRHGLSDGVLIKDNHLVHSDLMGAVKKAKALFPDLVIEVECDTVMEVKEAVAAGADLILLDNMSPAVVVEAISVSDGVALEVSGGVTLETVAAYGATGVRYISVGAITHSAPALDIAMDFD